MTWFQRVLVILTVLSGAVSLVDTAATCDDSTRQTSLEQQQQQQSLLQQQQQQQQQQQPCDNLRPNDDCNARAIAGDCQVHPGWMAINCAASCAMCHLQNPTRRCDPERLDISLEHAYAPGDLAKVFAHMQALYPAMEMLNQEPPVAAIRNFVSPNEADRIIEHAKKHFAPSAESGENDPRGVMTSVRSQRRTSLNTWCVAECERDPLVRGLIDRIANATLAPSLSNLENIQVLKYTKGQHYVEHLDEDNKKMPICGPRVFTFFLYLNTVEAGGETYFPRLSLKVKPEKGTALIWANVLNSRPRSADWRAEHAALPVEAGTKYAANVWIHSRDFQTASRWGCVGPVEL